MRIVFTLGVAGFLAACSMSSTPPGGSCASRASADLNALEAAIQSAETNIERGFALVRQVAADGAQFEEVRVSVNRAKERQKLADLTARLEGVQAQTDAALALCG